LENIGRKGNVVITAEILTQKILTGTKKEKGHEPFSPLAHALSFYSLCSILYSLLKPYAFS
jgi:hypothetical protein